MEQGRCVASLRTDGLGGRLLALVNAMVLSEILDVPYGFTWALRDDAFHAIVSASELFQAEFLSRHLITDNRGSGYHVLKKGRRRRAELEGCLNLHGGLVTPPDYLHRYYDGDAGDLAARSQAAFARIPFHPAIAAVMEKARHVPLPPRPVALHLRAGDIIFGQFRFGRTFKNKVVSYPVAKVIIATLTAEGKTVVLFGEDAQTCALLAARPGVCLATDLLAMAPDAPNIEAAMAEIVLMSRCEEIHAGGSVFAVIAGLAGLRPLIDPDTRVPRREVPSVILADSEIADPAAPLPDLQRAFAYYMVFHSGHDRLMVDEAIAALDMALRYDPDNGFYRLARTGHLAAAGRPDDAEAACRVDVEASWSDAQDLSRPTFFTFLSNAYRLEKHGGGVDLARIAAVAAPNRPYIHFVLGLAANGRRDREAARRHAEVCLDSDPGNPAFVALAQLAGVARVGL